VIDYTEGEREKIAELIKSGAFSCTCPVCKNFWVRDYPFPVRTCPACGFIKPWADVTIVGSDAIKMGFLLQD